MKKNNRQNEILVSFIVTDYNIEVWQLRECIESILALHISPEEREIILIDDGSDIPTYERIADLMTEIEYFRQENQGLSVARNNGIEKASGRFIQFIDGDDCLLPNYTYCFREMCDGMFDILLFNRSEIRGAFLKGKTRPVGSGVDYMLHNNIYASAWGYIFRRELLSGGLRFTKGILHEDEEFTPLLILSANNVGRYEGVAYFYRKRMNSIIHSIEKKHLEQRFNDFVHVIERLGAIAQTMDGKKKKALTRRVNQLAMDHIYNIMFMFRDMKTTYDAVSTLKEKGLFPLPIRKYTMKYLIFAVMTRSDIGKIIIKKYINHIL